MTSEIIPRHWDIFFLKEKAEFLERIISRVPTSEQALVTTQVEAMDPAAFSTMRKESHDKIDTMIEGLRLSRHISKLTESIFELESRIEWLGGTVDQARKRSEALSRKTDIIALQNINQTW